MKLIKIISEIKQGITPELVDKMNQNIVYYCLVSPGTEGAFSPILDRRNKAFEQVGYYQKPGRTNFPTFIRSLDPDSLKILYSKLKPIYDQIINATT